MMSALRKELRNNILKYIYENTNLDIEILATVQEGIDDAIDFSSADADHKKPSNIPADSIMKFKQAEFEPLDEFTKLRRRVYEKIGKSHQSIRDSMKDQAIDMTTVEKSFDGSTIHIKIINRSPLLTYLRSGFSGEHSTRDSDALVGEANFIIAVGLEKGLADDTDIQNYVKQLMDLSQGKGTLGKIPIRDVLAASVELIGKDFIRKNVI